VAESGPVPGPENLGHHWRDNWRSLGPGRGSEGSGDASGPPGKISFTEHSWSRDWRPKRASAWPPWSARGPLPQARSSSWRESQTRRSPSGW
jgi:hypothetical protein